MLRVPIILTIVTCTLAAKLQPIHEWRRMDYVWESEEQRTYTISKKGYNPQKIFPNDVHKHKHRLFITTPALYQHAVPATVSTVSKKKGPDGSLLKPYPNWKWHNSGDCKGMTSVWRVAIDNCDRLWIMDSGKVAMDQVCEPQILVFDLNTDKLLERIPIPENIAHIDPRNKTVGRLTYLAVETEGTKCQKTWLYSTDYDGGLVIYNGSKMWRRDDDALHPPDIKTNWTIAGEEFSPPNGLFAPSLTPRTSSGDSGRLYFRGALDLHQKSALVKDLKNLGPDVDMCFTTSKYRFSSPLGAQAFSRDGILFFGVIQDLSIGCWNSNESLDTKHVDTVAQDNRTLQYVSSITFGTHPHRSSEDIYVMTNRFQKVRAGTLNLTEINFRVFRGSVHNLVKGSKCQLQCSGSPS